MRSSFVKLPALQDEIKKASLYLRIDQNLFLSLNKVKSDRTIFQQNDCMYIHQAKISSKGQLYIL